MCLINKFFKETLTVSEEVRMGT